MLISAPLLAYYNLDNQYILETNTSDIVVIVVFSQKELDGE
jgi:hypothetical protein